MPNGWGRVAPKERQSATLINEKMRFGSLGQNLQDLKLDSLHFGTNRIIKKL